jgi:hypothetical protein
MADLNSILGDPDFINSTPETKRQILSAHDQDFAAATPETQNQILAKYGGQPAGMISNAVSSVNAGLKAARDWMQPAANNLVNFVGDVASDFVNPSRAVETALRGTGPRSLFSGPSAETQAPPSNAVGRFAAEVVNPLPENLKQAGQMVGTVAMGPYGALWRVLGGAGGAGLGEAISGGDAASVGKAAGLAGVSNIVGEGVSGGISLAAKSIPGAVTRIRHQDATRMLEIAPEVSAGLGRVTPRGGTASEALQDLVKNGKTGLNDAKEEAIQRIEAALQEPRVNMGGGMPEAQGPAGPLNARGAPTPLEPFGPNAASSPAGGPTPDTFWSRLRGRAAGPEPPNPSPQSPRDILEQGYLGEVNTPSVPVPEGAPWQPRALVGERGVPIEIPSMGGSVSLREANAELTAIGEGLRHAQILDPTMRQREAGRAYAKLSEEIRQGLDAQQPGLGAAFQKTQEAYAAGLDYLKKIANPNNWIPGSKGIEFDSRALQKGLAKSPLEQQRTGERLGEAGSDALIDAVTRGEGLGRVDKIPSGGGGFLDALMEFLRGSKSGSMGPVQAAIRSVAPNVGAQYIGRTPYTIDPGIKVLIDLGLLKAADVMPGGTPKATIDAEVAEAERRRRTAADDPSLQLNLR